MLGSQFATADLEEKKEGSLTLLHVIKPYRNKQHITLTIIPTQHAQYIFAYLRKYLQKQEQNIIYLNFVNLLFLYILRMIRKFQ